MTLIISGDQYKLPHHAVSGYIPKLEAVKQGYVGNVTSGEACSVQLGNRLYSSAQQKCHTIRTVHPKACSASKECWQ
jgi:hypothetical protein